MYARLKQVGEKFRLAGELYAYEPITMGNINSTYKVTYDRGEGVFKSYLFQRVTHNDTKCNNVLFDRVTKEPIVVIDLDTIMPGMSIYDFADGVRFIANSSVEDEQDVSKVFFDAEKFRAFARGFIQGTEGALEPVEIEKLVKGTFSVEPFPWKRFHYYRACVQILG